MNAASIQVSAIEPSPWGQVALIYRRICVLRASGQAEAAAHLHSTEFSRTLEAIQQSAGPASADQPDTGDRLHQIMDAEEERVANASVLADLLAPLLAGQLRTAPSEAPLSATTLPLEKPAPTAFRPTSATPPTVADLIEGMLVQERAARAPASRRAS